MTFEEAVKKIHSYQKFGSVLGLERIERLLDMVGNPQEDLSIVHVAGTNGKGSFCQYIQNIYQAAGYKVGMYTSPFIERFTERFQINGCDISHEDFVNVSQIIFDKVDQMIADGYDHPTEFEIITTIAFLYFKEKQVDLLVLEVGLGGRGDGTNVIKNPLLSVIMPIGYDHMAYLGDTLAKIAFEKAGIIKEGAPVLVSKQEKEALEVIVSKANDMNSTLTQTDMSSINIKKQDLLSTVFDVNVDKKIYHDVVIHMLGRHQAENATVAIQACQLLSEQGLKVSEDHIYRGLNQAKHNARFEVVYNQPTIVIDGAHNLQGVQTLKQAIHDYFEHKKILLCIGMLKDKSVEEVLSEILPLASDIVALEPPIEERKLPADELAEMIKEKGYSVMSQPNIQDALLKINEIKDEYDVVIFTGSLYMLGPIRQYFTHLQS